MGIQDIRETMESCKHCFMCRHACPTFLATKLDSHTPRGYALLLSEIDRGKLTWDDAVVDRFYQCSLCGLCREDCEYHWPEDELVRHAREEIVSAGAVPMRVSEIAGELKAAAAPKAGTKKAPVLYLAGVRAETVFSERKSLASRILDDAGIDWTMLEREDYSAPALFELGYTREAAERAKALIPVLIGTGAKTIVTSCPHTLTALTRDFPALGVSLPDGMEVFHLSVYLLRMIERGALKLSAGSKRGRIGYHDPCRLGRMKGVYDEPRKIISLCTGSSPRELFHEREHAECCGSGTVMGLTDPDIASRVAARRIRAAQEEGVDTLVTACQLCRNELGKASLASGAGVLVMDLEELISDSLK